MIHATRFKANNSYAVFLSCGKGFIFQVKKVWGLGNRGCGMCTDDNAFCKALKMVFCFCLCCTITNVNIVRIMSGTSISQLMHGCWFRQFFIVYTFEMSGIPSYIIGGTWWLDLLKEGEERSFTGDS